MMDADGRDTPRMSAPAAIRAAVVSEGHARSVVSKCGEVEVPRIQKKVSQMPAPGQLG